MFKWFKISIGSYFFYTNILVLCLKLIFGHSSNFCCHWDQTCTKRLEKRKTSIKCECEETSASIFRSGPSSCSKSMHIQTWPGGEVCLVFKKKLERDLHSLEKVYISFKSHFRPSNILRWTLKKKKSRKVRRVL